MFSTLRTLTIAGILLGVLPCLAQAQGTRADYVRAEQFLDGNLAAKIRFAYVAPHWIDSGDRFWYLDDGPGGKRFIEVNPAEGTRGPVFDQRRLAAALSKTAGHDYAPDRLPFDSFRLTDHGQAIRFEVDGVRWQCRLSADTCTKQERHGGHADLVSVSPDGHWAAFVRGHDLYVRNRDNGQITQLTWNGQAKNSYATGWPWLEMMVDEGVTNGADARMEPQVFWSPDSTRLVTYRLDTRRTGYLDSMQYVPPHQLRPRVFHYLYPLPGEPLPLASPIVFQLGKKVRRIDVKTPPLAIQTWGDPTFHWFGDNRHIRYLYKGRGEKYVELRGIDAVTGHQRVIYREDAKPYPYVDPYTTDHRFIDHGKRFLWTSGRSGWMQLYLYDTASGHLIRRLTHGHWAVRRIVHVDAKRGEVYFLASGVHKGMNPYDTQLYRVSLKGGAMHLLTPEKAYHQVRMSPDGKYFIDNYSTPDDPGQVVLRRSSDGQVVMPLEKTDTRWLTRQGWVPPIPFRGTATDGKTALYGLIVRPVHFDPARKYPVLEYIYTGPHNFFVPKTFGGTMNLQAMANLGFVVVMIDGRGTAWRSRKFRDFSYHNLGNVFGDHVAMIKQMGAKYPWMDLSRVGIYGYSHGGYGSTRAFLQYPDFYKVCVSTSGDHDARLDKAGWNELFQGYPVGKDYDEQASETLVKRLKGHLLLIHGDIDGNVNMAETMRLVDALMDADKPFDMLIVPNMAHGDSGPHANYVMLRRWNYFVRHLMGVTPPHDFTLEVAHPPAD
ncbi:MAG TPA: DPP IV N-terminal domain-containing protein [Rhodanobacteraceae bacterium]|nr:DPP IV N-terminal domain-containing protein [Rhodanobacteraceae bacterium]